ncbi:helix-turn-helix domain-containing protein [Streptomyces sp. NPDC048332]|uniref:helix-turn-helix domain-containing protein n=1 Tax=Streptomyces sp. NPDC048332 TaxID=3154619 RepID=UPI00344AC5EE
MRRGGGWTDVERAARERVRRQAVADFEADGKNREIPDALRVSERSAERWPRQWREGGQAGAGIGAWTADTRVGSTRAWRAAPVAAMS